MKLRYKCDVRDPYMGNTIPIMIELISAEFREFPPMIIKVTNGEGMTIEAHPIDPEDVHPMNT